MLDRAEKYFTVMINGRKDTVSIHRLKPAHLDTDYPTVTVTSETPITSETPVRTTRSGRRVHFPRYLASYVP